MSFSVTYNRNDATGGGVPTDSLSYARGSNVTIKGNTGNLVKTGYTFDGWNTEYGTWPNYFAGNILTNIQENTDLYAIWLPNYSVRYDGNGSTGGVVPTDSSSPYAEGSNITIKGNTGNLVRTGRIFTGWRTPATNVNPLIQIGNRFTGWTDGSEQTYGVGGTLIIVQNTILYAVWKCTITYDGNGFTDGDVPTDSLSPYEPSSNVTILGNTENLVKTGYIFTGWNTAANGTGSAYDDGSALTNIQQNTTLYAVWKCTITYDGNGSTSGAVPTDSLSPYTPGSSVTIEGNTNYLDNPGYTFSGWNTATNGSGTAYAVGNTLVIGQNTTLYAVWKCTITYDGNGSNSGVVPTDSLSPYTSGSSVTILSNTGNLDKTDYIFSGWADETGSIYAVGSTLVIGQNTTLYALWKCSITYDGNGSINGAVPTDSLSPYTSGSSVTIKGNTGNLVRTGRIFTGWVDGSGTAYDVGSTIIHIQQNTILYAVWKCSITYDGNGSTSEAVPSDPNSPYTSGSSVTILSNIGNISSLFKTDYIFTGWNTTANGTGTNYAVDSALIIEQNTILYAVWKCLVTYDGNGATGGAVPTDSLSLYTPGSSVTILENTGGFINTGYIFTGWADGTGTNYAVGSTLTIGQNTTLFAVWKCSVTYDGNEFTGGEVPTDSLSPYVPLSSVTIKGNTGYLDKTNYTFSGWVDGTGTTYAVGSTLTIEQNITLYALWKCTITYEGNGATGGAVPSDPNSPYTSGSSVTILSNTGNLVKTNYIFSGWVDGTGTAYVVGSALTNIQQNTTLYAVWKCSITYDGNGSTSGAAPTDLSSYITGSSVTIKGNTGNLNKTGYIFTGWADETGRDYAVGSTLTIGQNTTLFAVWKCSVTYNGNGSTGGTLPTDSSSPYASGSSVTILENTGNLVRTGRIFTGWNTAANGTGTNYAVGSTLTNIQQNTTLYAVWLAYYSVTYSGNGSTGGAVPSDPNSPYASGSSVTILSNTGNLVKTNYTFSGWNTGTGTNYAVGSTLTNILQNTTLYAVWKCSVTYDGNGFDGGVVPTDSLSPYASGAIVTILSNTGSLVKTGYIFTGWNSATNGTGTNYAVGATFTITQNRILFAVWKCSVTYDGDGFTGGAVPTDSSSPYAFGSNVTIKGNTGTLVKTGYTFGGWVDGTGTNYAVGSTLTNIQQNTTLFAVWKCSVIYNGNGSSGGAVPTDSLSPYASGSSVTIKGNTNNLVKTGYTFGGWVDGSGTDYAPDSTLTIGQNTTLYAVWMANYSVTYDGNGATDGAVPTDSLSPYAPGSSLTILSNTGFDKTGHIFTGWTDGTGTNYAVGSTLTNIQQNTTLYAVWKCSVTYDGDGFTDGAVPTDSLSPYAPGSSVTIKGNTGNLVKTGYTFTGWIGASYAVGGTLTNIQQNTTLYAVWKCSVTYDGDGSTSGAVPTDSLSPYAPGSSVTILENTSLVKTGYTFGGWIDNGTGASYAVGDTLSDIQQNTTLYAIWNPDSAESYSVTYDGNGFTDGAVPTDSLSPYAPGSSVTIKGNTGILVKTGYIFTGWTDGTGTNYAVGSTLTNIQQNTTLYAAWIEGYSVTYDGNGFTGGEVPTDSLSPYARSSNVTILGAGNLVYGSYSFIKWNTASDGTGSNYNVGGTLTNIQQNITLYAVWKCLVTYNGNGSTGGNVPIDSLSPYAPSSSVTIKGNGGGLSKTGYIFGGWTDGTGTYYAIGSTLTNIQQNITLYALWKCSITYNKNYASDGAVPTDPNSPYVPNFSVTILGNTGNLSRPGYIFARWNTNNNGSGTDYAPDSTLTIGQNTTLYAVWEHAVTYDGNGSTGGEVPTDSLSYAPGSSVTIKENTGNLVKTGYPFNGWVDGSGTHYAVGSTLTNIQQNTILYAVWKCAVTYDGNGSTGGFVPIDSLSPYDMGSPVIIFKNTGNLVNPGYTFTRWIDETGTSYNVDEKFTIYQNTILYAKWVASVTYDPTGIKFDTNNNLYIANGAANNIIKVDNLGNQSILASGFYYTQSVAFDNTNTYLYVMDDTNTIYKVDVNGNVTTFITNLNPHWYGMAIDTNNNLYYSGAYDNKIYKIDTNGNTTTFIDSSDLLSYPIGLEFDSNGNLYICYLYSNYISKYNSDGTLINKTFIPIDNIEAGLITTLAIDKNNNIYTGYSNSSNSRIDKYDVNGGLISNIYTGPQSLILGLVTDSTGSVNFTNSSGTIITNDNGTIITKYQYSVTYDHNGSTGGDVPTDFSSPYDQSSSITILDNTGNLVKTGYTFSGWTDGTGTSYAVGGTLDNIQQNTTLYAVWNPDSAEGYSVTYDGNGFTGGAVPTDSLSPYAPGSSVTIKGNTGILVKTGHIFTGWIDGTGASYAVGGTLTNIQQNTTLYAVWKCSVTYDGDGFTDGAVPTDSLSPYAPGSSVTIKGNTGNLVKTGYTFTGWIDETGISYSVGSTLTNIQKNTTLFVVWAGSVTYDPIGITFDTNNNLYIANGSANNIIKVDSLGNQSIIALGFDYTQNVVFDNTHTYLYVMDNTNTIYKVDVNGNVTTFITNLNNHYFGMAFDNNNNLYYSYSTSIDVYTIYKIDTNGNTTTFIDSNDDVLFSPMSLTLGLALNLAFDSNNNLYVCNLDSNYVSKYNSDGELINTTFISTSNSSIKSLTIDTNDNIYIIYSDSDNSYINKYNVNGSLISTIYTDPTNSIQGLAIDSMGNINFTNSSGTIFTNDNGTIITKYQYSVTYDDNGSNGGDVPTDPNSPYLTGSSVTILENINNLVKTGHTFAGWTDETGTTYDIGSTLTNIQQNITLFAVWVGSITYDPTGITFDTNNNLYIANGGRNNIIKVDNLGNHSIFASGFNYTENVVFNTTNGYLYVMDAGYSIYKVDANGNVSTFITNLNSHWYGMAFDSNNNLCYSSSDGKKIYKIDTNGNTTTFIDNDDIMGRSDVLSSPKSLAFDSNGNLYICNSNSINKYNSAGILINKTFISIPNVNINNLIIDKNDIYIIYSDSNNSYVNKYNINGNLIYNIYTDPTNSILGLAIDSIGNITFINNNGTIFTYKLGVPPINICFPKGTPIETDQGTFAIDHIADILERAKLTLTINRKPIIAISQTLSTEKTLVCFDPHALGPNIPNKPTIVSPEHKVGYNGHLMSAKYFVKHSLQKKIYEIPHCSDNILYNVLLDDYSVIKVNNLSVETLHPQNPIAVIQKNNIKKESDKNKQK